METDNAVAKLNEYAQRTRLELRYEEVAADGPDHIKTFTLRVVFNGKVYPDGVGRNKKEAKLNAAKNALRCLFEDSVDYTEKAADTSNASVDRTSFLNHVCWLNEYGNKNRLLIKAVKSTRLGPDNATQGCKFWVGDKEYPAGYGKTQREAKEEAAKLVYNEISSSITAEPGDVKCVGTPSPLRAESRPIQSGICDNAKSQSVKTEGANYIGLVNQYCQKNKYVHDFILEKRCGQPHSPLFFYKLRIDNKDYPVAEGKSSKEAKQIAAQLAWAALQEKSDWDSKVTFNAAMSEGSPSGLSILPRTLDSRDTQSQNVSPTTGDSAVFSSSINRPTNQGQSPDVKPKIRLAANFLNARRRSTEDFERSGEKTSQAKISRFTSEFDSIECLGKGSFGQVYKAKEKLLKMYYAIKIVRWRGKPLREVTALSELLHCNIVRYYTCWVEDSGYQNDSSAESSSSSMPTDNPPGKYLYIKMELCSTKTLRLWINEKNARNVAKSSKDDERRKKSLNIARQIASGVEYIHSKAFIHRDLKPANILFGNKRSEVKIGDFGLVTDENDDDAENLLERTAYKGTPSYMAPEQKTKSTCYDRKVDIFALGLIYFELFWNLCDVGREIWEDARNQKLPQGFSKNFPEENRILRSMLSLKPEDRPAAERVKKDLEGCSRTPTTKERNTV